MFLDAESSETAIQFRRGGFIAIADTVNILYSDQYMQLFWVSALGLTAHLHLWCRNENVRDYAQFHKKVQANTEKNNNSSSLFVIRTFPAQPLSNTTNDYTPGQNVVTFLKLRIVHFRLLTRPAVALSVTSRLLWEWWEARGWRGLDYSEIRTSSYHFRFSAHKM